MISILRRSSRDLSADLGIDNMFLEVTVRAFLAVRDLEYPAVNVSVLGSSIIQGPYDEFVSVLLQILNETKLVLDGPKKTRLLLSSFEAVVENSENFHGGELVIGWSWLGGLDVERGAGAILVIYAAPGLKKSMGSRPDSATSEVSAGRS